MLLGGSLRRLVPRGQDENHLVLCVFFDPQQPSQIRGHLPADEGDVGLAAGHGGAAPPRVLDRELQRDARVRRLELADEFR